MKKHTTIIFWLSHKTRQRIIIVSVALLIGLSLFFMNLPTASTLVTNEERLSGMVIGIDAGHGGADGGAASKAGAIEKDLNLAIALHLRDYLQQAGAIVVLTREADYDLAEQQTKSYSKRKTEDLLERVARLKQANVEMVISIHMNSIPSNKWSGAQTFYDKDASEDSKQLAYAIQQQIKEHVGHTKRESKDVEGIYLIHEMSKVPTALVEVGFLSNEVEAKRLVNAEYQRLVAASIYTGILNYLDNKK